MPNQTPNNDLKIELPNSPYINTTLGLKHLNHNKKLYLKILHSFIERYQNLNLKTLSKEELDRTLHIIKGLTATLGMESLNHTVEQLENNIDESLLSRFSQQLETIVIEIKNLP
ncbi:Hpt domain-containing protein [bacterium]|nr:Hpt domain-containing protein [bacterium]MBU1957991.1 Hpt domain-containing protein [bacterium]